MWVMLNHAFLSIVASDRDPSVFSVRARARGDIQSVFGSKVEVVCLDARDYAFRAFIPRAEVAAAMAGEVAKIDYTNFKDSVKEKDRHDTYFRVWQAMADFQAKRGHGRPYQTSRTGRGRIVRTRTLGQPWQETFDLPFSETPASHNAYDHDLFDPDWDRPPRRGFHGLTEADFAALEEESQTFDAADGTRFIHGLKHPDDAAKPKRRRGRKGRRVDRKKRVT